MECQRNKSLCDKRIFRLFKEIDADIFCLQETKLQEGQINLELDGYHQYWNYAEKKGIQELLYSQKQKPLSVNYGIQIEEHDKRRKSNNTRIRKFLFCNSIYSKFTN